MLFNGNIERFLHSLKHTLLVFCFGLPKTERPTRFTIFQYLVDLEPLLKNYFLTAINYPKTRTFFNFFTDWKEILVSISLHNTQSFPFLLYFLLELRYILNRLAS